MNLAFEYLKVVFLEILNPLLCHKYGPSFYHIVDLHYYNKHNKIVNNSNRINASIAIAKAPAVITRVLAAIAKDPAVVVAKDPVGLANHS